MKEFLTVLGVHRSGTSAMARLLSYMGAELPVHLMEAVPGNNDRGFWESVEVVQANDDLLALLNSDWEDHSLVVDGLEDQALKKFASERISEVVEKEFPGKGAFVLKDPRLCRLLPLWIEAQPEATFKFCITLRHPYEVAASLESRDRIPAAQSGLIWTGHILSAIKNANKGNISFVFYEDLLSDWRSVASSVSGQLGLECAEQLSAHEEEISAFISPDQKHQHWEQYQQKVIPETLAFAVEIYEELKRSVSGEVIDYRHLDRAILKWEREFHPYCGITSDLLLGARKRFASILEDEKDNSARQVEYREQLVVAARDELKSVNENADKQIAFRDKLLDELREQLESHKENANQQISYRDDLITDLQGKLEEVLRDAEEQVCSIRKNADEQIEYRDELVQELEKQLEDVRANADAQIRYRDSQIVQLENQKSSLREKLSISRKALASPRGLISYYFAKLRNRWFKG